MAGLTTLDALPSVIDQGATLLFLDSPADYTAPDWSLSYAFRNRKGQGSFTLTAVDAGSAHYFEVGADVTAGYAIGEYTGECRATHTNGQVAVVWRGTVTVNADIANAPDGYDTRTPARKILDSLLELATARASSDVSSYTVASQSFTHAGDADLRQRIAYWQSVVDAEEGKSNRVVIRFQ